MEVAGGEIPLRIRFLRVLLCIYRFEITLCSGPSHGELSFALPIDLLERTIEFRRFCLKMNPDALNRPN